jgi:hypothetical protein
MPAAAHIDNLEHPTMKKAFLLPALVAALPLAATAQTNVTLYGVADAAVGAADRGSSVGNSLQVFSGVQSTSRFGLRGTEDLGGGLKAVMNLEAGYSIDDGSADASSSGLFQRRAVVGLEGGFGTLLLGRDYTPGYTLAQVSDVMSYGLFGNLLSVQSPWGHVGGQQRCGAGRGAGQQPRLCVLASATACTTPARRSPEACASVRCMRAASATSTRQRSRRARAT